MNAFGRLAPWMISRFVGALADQCVLYCIPLLVYRSTHSVSATAWAYAVEWLPRVGSLLFSGSLVDRWGPRRICLGCDSVRAIIALCAFGLCQFSLHPSYLVYGFLGGVLGLFYEASFVGFDVALTRLSTSRELTRVQSYLQGSEQIAMVLGPGLALLLSARLGLEALFGVAAVFFLFAYFLLWSLGQDVPSIAHSDEKRKSVRHDTAAGFRFLFQSPALRALAVIGFGFNLAFGLALATTPAYLQTCFRLSEAAFGYLATAAGITATLIYLLLPRLVERLGILHVGSGAAVGAIIASFLMGSTPTWTAYVLGYILITAAGGAYSIFGRTLRAQLAPTKQLGAITSAYLLVLLSALPISGLLVAVLSPFIGVRALHLGIAATNICIVLLGSRILYRLKEPLQNAVGVPR